MRSWNDGLYPPNNIITMSLSLVSGLGGGSIWKETIAKRTCVEIRKAAVRHPVSGCGLNRAEQRLLWMQLRH